MTTSENAPRMRWDKVIPDVYKAMYGFEQSTREGLDPVMLHLVKLRTSQINGCAYCLDMHSKDARAGGESEQRLHLLAAWREAPGFFSEQEQAALDLTEAVTLVADGHVPDEVYQHAAKHFPEDQLARLIAAIVAINAWNRFQVATRALPGEYQPPKAARA